MKRLLISLFVLSILLAACGGNPTTSAPDPAATTAPAVAATIAPATEAPAAATSVPAATATPIPAATAASVRTPTVALAAPESASDPKSAVVAAMQAQYASGPYRTLTTIVTDDGTLELTGEVVPPDRLHTTMKASGFESESIFIGDKGWTKTNGVWTASPISGSDAIAQAFPNMTTDELGAMFSDVRAAGADTVNGEPTRVYTYTSITDLGEAGTVSSSVKLWVSSRTGLPVKQEVEGEAAGVKSKTTQLIEFDPTITIEPPQE